MITAKSKFGNSWILLTSAFALHVIDEAIFDFLPFYNSVVLKAKEKFSFIPLPNFTFQMWLSGLIAAIILLFLLSKIAFQAKRWILTLSLIYGIIMSLNGILHLLASIYYSKPIGGVYSSPLLIIGSVYLLWNAIKIINLNKQITIV
jgi:hypothetical protein